LVRSKGKGTSKRERAWQKRITFLLWRRGGGPKKDLRGKTQLERREGRLFTLTKTGGKKGGFELGAEKGRFKTDIGG